MTHSPENRRRFSAPTFGAEIWTVCHGLKIKKIQKLALCAAKKSFQLLGGGGSPFILPGHMLCPGGPGPTEG